METNQSEGNETADLTFNFCLVFELVILVSFQLQLTQHIVLQLQLKQHIVLQVTLYFIGPLVNAILDMQMRRGPEGPLYIGKKRKKVKKIAF